MPLLHVTATHPVTPHVVRVRFTGDGLDDFPTWPDQQLKLLIPKPGHPVPDLPADRDDKYGTGWYQAYQSIPEPERPWMRSYTVRDHHPDTHEIDIDFVLHADAGPATRWAATARPGDTIGRYGPSAAYRTRLGRFDWILLAGDETAIPAIAGHLAALPHDARAVVRIEISDPAEEQPLDTAAELDLHWVHRGTTPPGHGTGLLNAVRAAPFPDGEAFAWIAGEAGTVRAIRRHLIGDRGLDKRRIDFAGYWRLALTQDDAPTEEDLAEARERVAD
ncbi:NADPH-dependent ferric siderophore reductase [Saccharothrix tamanrassetensis]|uniref:NADPH-dependent ferric siderophore reductase n=1 Tax=Saccharothrix tamanrassetensis TaxID=1051531 RepID=A0A841CBK6_9PSEU|nr:siderophore-interacting protein [Saccharothrix tamanrassetensis]MBB5953557.1 NADPH-dependent ferric siderophore reductase [Saccharothrix tamanrassetensis]